MPAPTWKGRGISKESVSKFELGLSPPGTGRVLFNHLLKSGVKPELMGSRRGPCTRGQDGGTPRRLFAGG